MEEPPGAENCELDHESAKKKKVYAVTLTIADNDHISSLSGDCLISIFTLLNHSELDSISTVSQTFNQFVNQSRTKAVKLPGYNKLEINQTASTLFKTEACLELIAKDAQPTITKIISNDPEISPEKSAAFTIHRIFKMVNSVNIRFGIDEQYFTMDEINDDFLEHCEKWRHKPRMLSIRKRWGSTQNPVYYERLMKWLSVCGIKHICLNGLRITDFVTPNFLHKLTLFGTNPSLFLSPYNDDDQITLDSYNIFPSFSSLYLPELTVDVNSIIQIIAQRYRRNVHGHWVFRGSSHPTSDIIRNLLDPDMIYDRCENYPHGSVTHTIRMRSELNIPHRLMIVISRTSNLMTAHFYGEDPGYSQFFCSEAF